MGIALYRKYRSRKLSEVVGQEHVTTLLSNALKSGQTAHAYLFTGPKGVGKTSIARILAHEINELEYSDDSTYLDIIEIDAASNNGVEDIRDLRDRVQIAPVSAKKKVYIIDEVHMLSKQAFNALLKTLEEPPEHVVFILATTDIDKVPETIISRTQRHTFRRASESDIIRNLQRIAASENVQADENSLRLVARHSDGSFRDSVSLFDQLVSGSGATAITTDHVTKSLGLVPEDTVQSLLQAAVNGDIAAINSTLLTLETDGVPPRTTASQLADHLRQQIVSHPEYSRLIDELLDVSRSHYPELKLLTVLSLYGGGASSPTTPMPTPTPVPPATPPVQKPSAEQKPKEAPAKAQKQQNQAAKAEPKTDTPTEQKSARQTTPESEFDWKKLISHVKTYHVALHSVLSKCEPEVIDGTLKLYTKSAFYKKKLDELRYRGLLVDSLAELGHDFTIETIAEQKPMKDSQAAQVAAIMGGGEEVSVDDA